MNSNFQELMNNLDTLGLSKMHAYLPDFLDQINDQELSFSESLLKLTSVELEWRGQRQVQRIVERARFPQNKSLKTFDFSFPSSINQQKIKSFGDLAFLEKQENLVFIGSPSVGKTHLAIGISMAACQQGKRTLFINLS